VSEEEPAEEAPRPVEADDAEAEARPARRKRKKKRPEAVSDPAASAEVDGLDEAASSELDEAAEDERPARRDGIPAFALGFPEDPALDALVAAFEQGDYACVRREAPALVKSTDSVAVRKATRELVKRLDPDPVAVYLLAGAALLLAFLAFWYWTHPHGAP
jgi:hypothetical protein